MENNGDLKCSPSLSTWNGNGNSNPNSEKRNWVLLPVDDSLEKFKLRKIMEDQNQEEIEDPGTPICEEEENHISSPGTPMITDPSESISEDTPKRVTRSASRQKQADKTKNIQVEVVDPINSTPKKNKKKNSKKKKGTEKSKPTAFLDPKPIEEVDLDLISQDETEDSLNLPSQQEIFAFSPGSIEKDQDGIENKGQESQESQDPDEIQDQIQNMSITSLESGEIIRSEIEDGEVVDLEQATKESSIDQIIEEQHENDRQDLLDRWKERYRNKFGVEPGAHLKKKRKESAMVDLREQVNLYIGQQEKAKNKERKKRKKLKKRLRDLKVAFFSKNFGKILYFSILKLYKDQLYVNTNPRSYHNQQ